MSLINSGIASSVVSLTPKQRPISLRLTKRAGGTSPTVLKSISSWFGCFLRFASSALSSSWLSLSQPFLIFCGLEHCRNISSSPLFMGTVVAEFNARMISEIVSGVPDLFNFHCSSFRIPNAITQMRMWPLMWFEFLTYMGRKPRWDFIIRKQLSIWLSSW